MTRREFLHLAGLAIAVVTLDSCGLKPSTSETPRPTPASPPSTDYKIYRDEREMVVAIPTTVNQAGNFAAWSGYTNDPVGCAKEILELNQDRLTQSGHMISKDGELWILPGGGTTIELGATCLALTP